MHMQISSQLRHCHAGAGRTRAAWPCRMQAATKDTPSQAPVRAAVRYQGIHHAGFLVQDTAKSVEWYRSILDMEARGDRPDDKLPYGGAWLSVGHEMIHLMELPNPDSAEGRPEHGGRDRHVCIGVEELGPLRSRLEEAGVPFTASKSGRAAIFFRDPDGNVSPSVDVMMLSQAHVFVPGHGVPGPWASSHAAMLIELECCRFSNVWS